MQSTLIILSFLTFLKMAGEPSFQNSAPPSWLNAEFVQTALRSGDCDPAVTVVSIDVVTSSSGSVFGTDIYQVAATLDNGEERSIIVKCHAQKGFGRELANLFDREINMHTETLPELNRLLENACPDEFKPLGPKCLFHGNEPVPFLVLEDLTKIGFNFGKRKYGLDYAHCFMALKKLAHFHAASMALNKQNPEKMEFYTKSDGLEKFHAVVDEMLGQGVSYLANEVKNWPGFEKYSEKLLKVKDSVCKRFAELVGRKEDSMMALINADTWASYLMFKYSENSIEDVRLNDFQTVVFGSPILELQHYLYACSTFMVQMDGIYGIDNLIRVYHTTLSKTLVSLGCAELSLSYDDFLKLYSEYDFYSFYVSTSVFPLQALDPPIKMFQEDSSEDAGETSSPGGTSKEGGEESAGGVPPGERDPFKGKVYKFLMQFYLPMYEEQGII